MLDKIKQFNGWQRLWLVGSVAVFAYYVGLYPVENKQQYREILNNLYRDARVDFSIPGCKPYQTAPFASLVQPKGGEFKPGSCSHIWRHRSEAQNPDAPYTEVDFDRELEKILSRHYWSHLQIGLLVALVVSALAYFGGWVVAWVLRGFRKK